MPHFGMYLDTQKLTFLQHPDLGPRGGAPTAGSRGHPARSRHEVKRVEQPTTRRSCARSNPGDLDQSCS